MHYVYGRQIVCDSCGHKVFLERIPFAPKEEYDADPEGWTNAAELGTMCPVCTKKFGSFVSDMFGISRVPDKWQFIRPSDLTKSVEE